MPLPGELGLKVTARLTYGQTQILTIVVYFGFAVFWVYLATGNKLAN